MLSQKQATSSSRQLLRQAVRLKAAARAELYRVAADLTDEPPTYPKLRHWLELLEGLPSQPPAVQATTNLLRQALLRALENEELHCEAWDEFDKLLRPSSRSSIHPFASIHCDPRLWARLNSETCPFQADKGCPFTDWYCTQRIHDPCDHFSAGLRLAARLWSDTARAGTAEKLGRARTRRKRFAKQHLTTWVCRVGEVLFREAETGLYQAAAMLTDALIREEIKSGQ